MAPSPVCSPETEKNSAKNGKSDLANPDTKSPPALDFEETFKFLLDDAFSGLFLPPYDNEQSEHKINMRDVKEWLKVVMLYNVPKGKQFRGRLVELAYKGLAQDVSEEMLQLARILGWCVEILQASFLVADDIMDNGQLRRGQLCWHRVDNKNQIAINDVFLLEHATYHVIHKYFRHLPCYTDLLDICLGNTFKTIIGQSLDTRASFANEGPTTSTPFENYSMELYNSIVRYKTSYYTCYLPVALAMCLAGITRNCRISLWQNVEKATLEIGHLFQVQDDYFDCFADERKLGKIGMDIQEGKCTWLFVTAKELLKDNPEKYSILVENYGKVETQRVRKVKQLYRELEIPRKFEDYQEHLCRNIVELIRRLNHSGLENVLIYFFDLIYKRTY